MKMFTRKTKAPRPRRTFENCQCKDCKPRPPAAPAPAPLKRDPLVQRLLAIASEEVGYHEGKTGGNWNNRQKYAREVPGLAWADGQPWCQTFVSWLAREAGCPELFPVTASCDVAGQWYKDRDRWRKLPAIGAHVFFGKPDDLSHTGIVIGFTPTTIITIEGNTNVNGSREGDGVYQKVRQRTDYIIGYGYPKYPAGLIAANGKGGRRQVK